MIAFIAIACGLSPFLYGFYDVGVWGPIALGMLAAFLGLLIARPAAPRPAALVAGGALALFWLWALLSTSWAESADQALIEANRWLLYAALLGVLVLLLRDDRLGTIVIAAGAGTIVVFGGYLLARMLAGTASSCSWRVASTSRSATSTARRGSFWSACGRSSRSPSGHDNPGLRGAGAAGVSALAGTRAARADAVGASSRRPVGGRDARAHPGPDAPRVGAGGSGLRPRRRARAGARGVRLGFRYEPAG